jgi:hypothetical protein
MAGRATLILGALIGLAVGAGLGLLAGRLIRSDNLPFFVALGAIAGVCLGLGMALRRRRVRGGGDP